MRVQHVDALAPQYAPQGQPVVQVGRAAAPEPDVADAGRRPCAARPPGRTSSCNPSQYAARAEHALEARLVQAHGDLHRHALRAPAQVDQLVGECQDLEAAHGEAGNPTGRIDLYGSGGGIGRRGRRQRHEERGLRGRHPSFDRRDHRVRRPLPGSQARPARCTATSRWPCRSARCRPSSPTSGITSATPRFLAERRHHRAAVTAVLGDALRLKAFAALPVSVASVRPGGADHGRLRRPRRRVAAARHLDRRARPGLLPVRAGDVRGARPDRHQPARRRAREPRGGQLDRGPRPARRRCHRSGVRTRASATRSASASRSAYVWRVVGRPRPGAGDVSGLRVREILRLLGRPADRRRAVPHLRPDRRAADRRDPGRRPGGRPVRHADAARLVPALPGRRGLDGGRATAGAHAGCGTPDRRRSSTRCDGSPHSRGSSWRRSSSGPSRS